LALNGCPRVPLGDGKKERNLDYCTMPLVGGTRDAGDLRRIGTSNGIDHEICAPEAVYGLIHDWAHGV
jgi:hypothetical protein